MIELERQINDIMNKINQIWVTALKEADKKDEPIDLSEIFGKYSELVQAKDNAFQDAKVRNTKKKGWM